jgi:hypothetical protein
MSEKKKQEPYEKSETIPKVQGKVWNFLSDLAMGRKWVYVANTDEAEYLSAEITRMLMSAEYRWCLHDLYALVKKIADVENNGDGIRGLLKLVEKNGDKEQIEMTNRFVDSFIDIFNKQREVEKTMKRVGL